MKKVKIKIPAKLNLTLDVTGRKDGYHVLDSLFVSVNVCDEIVVKERKDEGIRLSFLRKKIIGGWQKIVPAQYRQRFYCLARMSVYLA